MDVLFDTSDAAHLLVCMHFLTKKSVRVHEEMSTVLCCVLRLRGTTGLEFDVRLVAFGNSSKSDVNGIILLTLYGTPAMVATKKLYFSVSGITV